ncbi:MAG TPA: GNAT family N-acetyltransferase [Kofleriaceae bacterium]
MRLPARVELPDGTVLAIRELHASDEPTLRAWFASLSNQSRYQRFHGHVGDLSDAHWRYLTRIDGVDHTAIVATHENRFVAIARMIRLEGGAAEIAFLVGDDQQRRRIGSLLRDVLISIAQARAYSRLLAFVLPNNVAIRKLLGDFTDKGNVLELELAS